MLVRVKKCRLLETSRGVFYLSEFVLFFNLDFCVRSISPAPPAPSLSDMCFLVRKYVFLKLETISNIGEYRVQTEKFVLLYLCPTRITHWNIEDRPTLIHKKDPCTRKERNADTTFMEDCPAFAYRS